MKNYSRRSFLDLSRRTFSALGLLPLSASLPSLAAEETDGKSTDKDQDYYDKLGVTKIINAAGTYTYLTAAIMPDQVRRAVTEAAKHPVRLKELQQAAGEYLARKLKCEAALVSAGASSALTLGTAACVTVANWKTTGEKIYDLMPVGMAGLKNEVIVQKTHRYDYDHALLNCGIRFVEVETLDQYEAAFNSNTVMAHFFNAAVKTTISREDWVRVAHKHGVPCMNDAAADVPPISNLWNYTQMGFDLVAFSGGKGIRGPQNAGLLLGKKELIDAATQNNSPISERVGRGMKVAKEQLVGMVAAVDWFLEQSDEGMQTEFNRRAEFIAKQMEGLPSMKTQIYTPEVANHIPHLLLQYDPQKIKVSPLQVADILRKGSPSIELNPATGTDQRAGLPSDKNTIVIGVWMLQEGEEKIVAQRLHQVLSQAVSS